MMYLLDTCAISEIRKPYPDPRLITALQNIPEEHLFLSVITLGELRKGIFLLPPGTKRNNLLRWVEGIVLQYNDRVLPIEKEVAELWGEVTAETIRKGNALLIADGLLAATAIHYGLGIITRNTKDFSAAGVRIFNPWS